MSADYIASMRASIAAHLETAKEQARATYPGHAADARQNRASARRLERKLKNETGVSL